MNTSRLSVVIYGLVVLITTALFLAVGSWEEGAGSRLLSLFALLFAETMGWLLIGYAGSRGGRNKSVPVRLLFMTITGLYGAAVVFHLVLFWLVLSVSFVSYLVIHLITWGIWALGMGLAYAYSAMVDAQTKRTAEQTRMIGRLQSTLFSIEQILKQLNRKPLERLTLEVQGLLERVKYSDPVSHRAVTSIEDSLLWQADALVTCVRKLEQNEDDAGNEELSRQLIADLTKDLERRNTLLKETKLERGNNIAMG